MKNEDEKVGTFDKVDKREPNGWRLFGATAAQVSPESKDRGNDTRQIRVTRAPNRESPREPNPESYAGVILRVLTLERRNRLTWSQMKSKTDDIQEREDDACGMTLFFDNHVDIGSKNSAKRG